MKLLLAIGPGSFIGGVQVIGQNRNGGS